METAVDVVVIGAGISGLSGACLLKREGLTVAVLEARDRVGGRTFTIRDPVHGAIDVGGAYVGPTQDRVFRLIKEFGLQVYNLDESRNSVMHICGKWSTYKSGFPTFKNPLAYLDLNNALRTIDGMGKQIPLSAPWKAPQASKWDKMTAQELFNKICWTQECREAMKLLANGVLSSEAHELSLLFFLTYIRSGQGIARTSYITHGAQEKKIIGGSQQLSEKMAERLGKSVHLNCPASTICQNEDSVVVTSATGQMFKCKHVISAIPLPLLSRIQFTPPFPAHKAQLIQRVPMGSVIKTITFYETAFWKDLGFSGMAASDVGCSVYCMDDTKPDGSNPAIMAFILADKSRELSQLSTDERKLKICEHLAEIFRCKKFLQPKGYVEKNWMEEEYSGGCFTINAPPGVLTQYGREMRTPFKRVFFAGTETARKWSGYMDGAIEAGERAAREILHDLGKIPESEIWQEEPESTDYPATPIPVHWIEEYIPSVPVFLTCLAAIFCLVVAVLITWM